MAEAPENVSAIIGVLTAKPSRKRRKIRTEPHTIVDTFQQRIAGRQAAMAMLEEYDTDINARESALWETAVNTLKTTTREERRIRYITLNRPELPETKEENQISVRAERAGINLLTLPQDNNHPTGRPVNGFHHKKKQPSGLGQNVLNSGRAGFWRGLFFNLEKAVPSVYPAPAEAVMRHRCCSPRYNRGSSVHFLHGDDPRPVA